MFYRTLIIRVFANGPVDLGSIPSRVIPKTQKMVLNATLLNTQQRSKTPTMSVLI